MHVCFVVNIKFLVFRHIAGLKVGKLINHNLNQISFIDS
jgi:hypothetical protein